MSSQNVSFGLTYSAPTGREQPITRASLYSFLCALPSTSAVAVAQEHHADGTLHYHAFWQRNSRARIDIATFFNHLDVHPNVKSIKAPKKWLEYLESLDYLLVTFGRIPFFRDGPRRRSMVERLCLNYFSANKNEKSDDNWHAWYWENSPKLTTAGTSALLLDANDTLVQSLGRSSVRPGDMGRTIWPLPNPDAFTPVRWSGHGLAEQDIDSSMETQEYPVDSVQQSSVDDNLCNCFGKEPYCGRCPGGSVPYIKPDPSLQSLPNTNL